MGVDVRGVETSFSARTSMKKEPVVDRATTTLVPPELPLSPATQKKLSNYFLDLIPRRGLVREGACNSLKETPKSGSNPRMGPREEQAFVFLSS